MREIKEKKGSETTESKAATKAAKKKDVSPVIEVDAVEEDCPFDPKEVEKISSEIVTTVEEAVSKEIVKYNSVMPAIADLTKEYMGLTISSIDDKEGYDKVSKGLRFVTAKGTAVEAVRKQLKDPYYRIGVAIDEKAKEIMAMINPIKQYLKDTKQVIDTAIIERDRLLEEERQKMLKKRNDMLTAAGMSLIGNTYVWRDPFDSEVEETLLYVNIETMDDADFNEEVQKIVDLAAAAKKRKQDELDKIEKERKENEKQQEAVKRERENIRNEKIQMRLDYLTELGCSVAEYREKRTFGVVEEGVVFYEHKNKGFTICTKDSLADIQEWSGVMQETKANIAEIKNAVLAEEEAAKKRKEKEDADEKERKEKEEAITKIQNERRITLEVIGLSYSDLTGFLFYNGQSIISYPELRDIEDSVWKEKVAAIKQKMSDIDENIKKEAEEKSKIDAEKIQKQAKAEQKKRDDEQKQREDNEKARIANLNDKDKLSEYVTKLLEIEAPEFKTPKYKELFNNIQKALNQYK